MLHSSELVRPFQVVHWEIGSENSEKTTHRATPFNSEETTWPPPPNIPAAIAPASMTMK